MYVSSITDMLYMDIILICETERVRKGEARRAEQYYEREGSEQSKRAGE